MSRDGGTVWSIDEMAQLVGVPSRTIREYRTQGLLPAPRKVGRVGFYDEGHRRRLELIGRMQARGYSLAGMRDLFEAWDRGESLEDVIGDTGLDEAMVTITTAQLTERLAAFGVVAARDAAVVAGVIHPAGDGRWHVRAPSLLVLVADAVRAGVSIDDALQTAAVMRDGARRQAEQLAATFVTELRVRADRRELERLMRRARVLIARSAAALVVDELALALSQQAGRTGDEGLAALIEAVRIGDGHSETV